MIARDVTLHWRGVEYVFTPSNRLLRRIEGEDISLIQVVQDLAKQRVKHSQLGLIIAVCLQSAGAKITEEEAAAALVTDTSAFDLVQQIMQAIFPETAAKKPSPFALTETPPPPAG